MPGHRFPFRRSAIAPSKAVCCRQAFARPSDQDGVARIGSFRGVPDVSAGADPTLGPAIAVAGGGQRYLVGPAGGTPMLGYLSRFLFVSVSRPLGRQRS